MAKGHEQGQKDDGSHNGFRVHGDVSRASRFDLAIEEEKLTFLRASYNGEGAVRAGLSES